MFGLFENLPFYFDPSLREMYGELWLVLKHPSQIWSILNPLGNFWETFAVTLAIIGLILQARHNIWGWLFTAAASIFLPFFLYSYYALLGDALLWTGMFIWFFSTALWAWYRWLHDRYLFAVEKTGVAPTFKEVIRRSHMADFTLSPETGEEFVRSYVRSLESWLLLLIIIVIFFLSLGFGWILNHNVLVSVPFLPVNSAGYLQTSLPYWDATTTVLAAFAQILLIRKYWESWILWLLVSILSIAMYTYKGAPAFALMYMFMFVIASISIFTWYSRFRHQKFLRWESMKTGKSFAEIDQ